MRWMVFGHEKICQRARRYRHWLFSRCRNRPELYVEKYIDRFQANSHENAMRKLDLDAMQFDELWLIHEELTKILSDRIVAEKRELEKRLAKLNRVEIISEPGTPNPLSLTNRPPLRK